MPKVSVYLPDDLYRSARDHDLPISTLTQRAIEGALRARATDRWIDLVRARPRRFHGSVDSSALIGDVRDEFGA